jgi:signal transduction histidine kinase
VTATAAAPLTLLIVDDDAPVRRFLRRVFERDYRVLEAADGESALAIIAAGPPDCILLDLVMPGLDGFGMLERLHADVRTRDIPVLVLTATEEGGGALERALALGAADYIVKPVSPAAVAARVRGAVERRRLARELDELRANYTSMLVHDLRSPLTLLHGYVQLFQIRSEGLSAQQRRYVASMREACNRMIGLITEILDIEKLEAGMLVLQRQPVEVAGLVAELVERLRPVAVQQSIELTFAVNGRPREVSADPVRLEQVVMNLLTNALKFTPAGGAVHVEVSGQPLGLEVSVSDTGPGITAEELPRLFEKYSQTSTGATKPGTGLGLVIARHLVDAHGGRIWVESAPGGGARFAFTLPG